MTFIKSFLYVILFLITLYTITFVSFHLDNSVNHSEYFDSYPSYKLLSSEMKRTQTNELRNFQQIVLLEMNKKDSIFLSISFPETINDRLPILFIMGGLNDGETYLNLLPHHGNTIIVGFYYPNNRPYWEDQIKITNLMSLRKSILSVPRKASIAIDWIRSQKYADKDRINFMSYSLGSLFAPSVLYYSQNKSISLKTSSIIYGSADLEKLIKHNLKPKIELLDVSISVILGTALQQIEPRIFIPDLKSNFHIINGLYDEKIPIHLAKETQQLYPNPKEILNIPEKHMHPSRTELTQKLIRLSMNWLIKNGSIED